MEMFQLKIMSIIVSCLKRLSMHSSCTLKPSLHSSLAPFCLAHLFAFAPLGLKETETSATQANSLEKSDVVIIYTSLKQ